MTELRERSERVERGLRDAELRQGERCSTLALPTGTAAWQHATALVAAEGSSVSLATLAAVLFV